VKRLRLPWDSNLRHFSLPDGADDGNDDKDDHGDEGVNDHDNDE
jgi:hypothetical protein